MKTGRLLTAYGGYFFVYDRETNQKYRAKIRGKLKEEDVEVIPGDRVRFAVLEDGSGVIEERLERKNALFRPKIANVEQIIIIFAVQEPSLHFKLLDRLLVLGEVARLDSEINLVLCLNKIDLTGYDQAQRLLAPYEKIGYQVLYTSAREKRGLDRLTNQLQDQVSVFAGPSGVGKSSLLNSIQPGLELKTGSISQQANQGRHTTRRVELLSLETGGWVADTPGFSSLDLSFIVPRELQYFFPELKRYIGQCKFSPCFHDHEPECAVKAAVQRGKVVSHRYEHYLEFLQEIKQLREETDYD